MRAQRGGSNFLVTFLYLNLFSVFSLGVLSHPFASVMRLMDAYLLSATVGCGQF